MVLRARDQSGNPLNPQFTLHSELPGGGDQAQIYHWPIGSGGSVSNTDSWPQHGDFQFGTTMHNGSNTVQCNGWIVLGPGTAGHVGNGWVLNCHSEGPLSQFWFSHIDEPAGQTGRWEMLDSSGNVLDNDVNNSTSNPIIKFPVSNGTNMRFTFVWIQDTTASLSGDSKIDGHEGTIYVKPNTSHTFTHTVTNTSGSPVSYSWSVAGNAPTGGKPAGNANNVPAGGTNPSPASDQFNPTSDMVGNTYCEYITYSNASGTAQGKSAQACAYVTNSPQPTHSLGCSETQYKVAHQNGERQYIQLSGTNSDNGGAGYYVAPDGSGSDSIDITYTAIAPTVHIYIHRYTWSGSAWVENSDSPVDHSYGCYHAACTQPYYDGDGPWDGSYNPDGSQHHIVQAGHGFKVFVPVTNNNTDPSAETISAQTPPGSSDGGHSFSLSERADDYQGGIVPHNTDFDLGVSEAQTKEIDFTANDNTKSIRDLTLNFYPDYYGYGSLGDGCSVSVRLYQKFDASVSATSDPSPTKEHPASDKYTASANFTWDNPPGPLADHGVNDTVSASFYKKAPNGTVSYPCASNTYSSGGPFTIQSNPTVLSNTCTIPPGSYQAGDEYCTTISSQYNTGYVGPDNGVVAGTGPATDTNCPRVVNEPYFKVFNGGISAGGEFDQCSTAGGELAGYNDANDPPGVDRGSSSELSALALIKITGVASAQSVQGRNPQNISRSPTALTFANANAGDIALNNESPLLGGNFSDKVNNDGCQTLTNVTPPTSAAKVTSTNPTIANVAALAAPSGPTGTPNAHVYDDGHGDTKLTINGGTLSGSATAGQSGQNISVYVNGDVYISNNITYGTPANGYPAWADAGAVPSFTLHATGNIYISRNVTSLAGVYIAQKNSGEANSGRIYTCAATGTNFAPMQSQSLYSCNNQLVVSGSFVADQVNLMRTYGSLRDEEPNNPTPNVNPTKQGYQFDPGTCYQPGVAANSENSCFQNGGAVTDLENYNVNYTLNLSEARTNYTLTINYDNYHCPCAPDWPPNGTGYNYLVAVYVDGVIRQYGYLPPSASAQNDSINIGALGAGNHTITIEALNNSGYIAYGGNPYAYDANFEIQSVSFDSPGSVLSPKGPPYNTCSNQGAEADANACAGEVFEFTPQLYMANPSITPPSGGSLQYQSLTGLPPVL
jgi:hypothetical protein